MLGNAVSATAVAPVVHIIQVALTPVFLLAGIATLLNVFATRLARVADQVESLAREIVTAPADRIADVSRRLTHLYRRSLALDAAVALGAAGGASICVTVFCLFIGEAGSFAIDKLLFVTFSLALICTLAAIGAFTAEMLMASADIRVGVISGQAAGQREQPAED